MSPVLELRGVTKIFPNRRGIRDISLTVNRGDIYGFFGPNGAGKTTVMKMLTGLARPQQGQLRLFGHDVGTGFEQAMAKVGVLIETAEAFTYMSARRNLEQAARFYPRLPKGRIDDVLALTGLSPYAHEKVAGYSLGMKQRLGLAAALLGEPELLILDEPTNGLDIEGMVQIRELIAGLAREQGITIFLSSHFIGEMEQLCSRIGILHEGRLIREAAISTLLQERGTLEAAYLHELNQVRGQAAHA
ncbi:ABC transporter ATP-binding protein [Paenibacillus whitsoniae]|uniref:ABC transporter ATP-binding protein n=1 Tax=Paenibacillus whitsoniae TaxID=2496558 RepID=A0A3S0AEL2_9BACL|nr:ABC transporter ATP-binding protein [Paenibacillus whitsoniae]RTE11137.1 ABC transporter ATP-binding protein [Paenibacillus whitsoniae]